MAIKQALVNRLLNKFSNRSCRISPLASAAASAAGQSLMPPNRDKVAPDKGEETIFRRFLQRRLLYLSATTAVLPELLRPGGGRLLERFKQMDIARNQIRLDGLISPAPARSELTVADAKKILRASQIETLKSKLRILNKIQISYEEFIQICVDGCSNNRTQALDLAKALDDSGSVIVLGNLVFLKPEEVLKAIHSLIPENFLAMEELPMAELEEMELWKEAIDKKAEKMVRRELWGGLGYLVVQTAAFMRLTFWELSWDVMEPICFYVTSLYFMICYAFFLRTSKEPSFEGFFQSRFHVKQRKLMKNEGFDWEKYEELKKACHGGGRLRQPWPREVLGLEKKNMLFS